MTLTLNLGGLKMETLKCVNQKEIKRLLQSFNLAINDVNYIINHMSPTDSREANLESKMREIMFSWEKLEEILLD